MLANSYADAVEQGGVASRARERAALARAADLLRAAQKAGLRTVAGAEAVYAVNRVWSFLIEDLSLSDNELPDDLRANLISIGIHVLRLLDRIRSGDSGAAEEVIEISDIIIGGLS
jgi:flagellar biosynthesis activator protein FlaF